MPWKWYADPEAIFWTLGLLGALIGPLFGILIADYYAVRKQKVNVDALFTMEESGEYFYERGYNPAAVKAVIFSGAISISSVVIPKLFDVLTWLPDYSWFLGCGVGYVSYYVLAKQANVAGMNDVVAVPKATV